MGQIKPETKIIIRMLASFLFVFGLFGMFGSLFMWGEGFIFPLKSGVNYRFPITDLLVNVPSSIIAAIGLWKLRKYGYIASQFVAGFYIYASCEIFVEEFQGGPPFHVEIIIPQVAASILAITLVIYSQYNSNGPYFA
jgi:hypothetical protein